MMCVNVCVLDHSEEAQALIYLIHCEMPTVQLGAEVSTHFFQSSQNRQFYSIEHK